MNELEVVVNVSGRQSVFESFRQAMRYADTQKQEGQAVLIYARYKAQAVKDCERCPLCGTAACGICKQKAQGVSA